MSDDIAMGVGQFPSDGEPKPPKVWCEVCRDHFTYSHFDGNGWHSVPLEDIDRAPLDFRSYMELAAKYDLYPQDKAQGTVVACLGIANEAGELAGIGKKMMRGDFGPWPDGPFDWDAIEAKIIKEAGDTLWYFAKLLRHTGLRQGQIMQANIEKLEDRLNRGVLQGSGDDR